MSLDLEARLRVFLASAPPRLRAIQTLEFAHPAMPTYRIWREPYPGQITTAEAGLVDVVPLAFEIALAGSEGHLDQVFSIKLDTTDADDQFRQALDAIALGNAEPVAVIYREYLSDDLSEPQAQTRLQAESVSYVKGAATISAVSPRLNTRRTGEIYSPKVVPMLRGFL